MASTTDNRTSSPVSILKRYHLNDGGLIEDVTGWLCQFEDAQVEIRLLSSALASIGEYDCPGGVSPKHCLGCAACDANKALENHGPVVPGVVGVTDLAARSPVETQPTTSNEGNDALRSFEIIWSVISQQYPYWAVANTMHADNVRVALSIAPDELQRAVGILATRRESSAHETSRDESRDAARYRFIRQKMTEKGEVTYYSMPHSLMFLRGVYGETAFDREVDARINGAAFESMPPEEPFRNQAAATSSGVVDVAPTPRGSLPNSLGTGGAGSHPAASSSEKAGGDPWAEWRRNCTCPKPGTSNSKINPRCPISFPHPWERQENGNEHQ